MCLYNLFEGDLIMIKLNDILTSKDVKVLTQKIHYVTFLWQCTNEEYLVRVLFDQEVHVSVSKSKQRTHLTFLDKINMKKLQELLFDKETCIKFSEGKHTIYMQSVPITKKRTNILNFR